MVLFVRTKLKYKTCLNNTLKTMKGTLPLDMRPIRQRRCENRSANTVWHLDTAQKLIKYNSIASVMIYGCSQKVMLLNCSNNNRAETACDLFLKAVREHITLLRVRGNIGSENSLLAHHMTLSRNDLHNGCTCGRSVHSTRVNFFGGGQHNG